MDKLRVQIGGDNRQLKATLNDSKAELRKFGSDVGALQALTANALQSSGANLALLGAKGAAGVVGIAAAGVAAVIKLANTTAEAAVEAGIMADKFGLSVEAFTRLDYAAKISKVSTEELGNGMKGLSVKMREASNGSEEARAVFKALGVEFVDSSGKLRPVEDVILDVANAFNKMPNGAQKAALAVKLMEESGLKLIPVLNQGAEAIKRLGDEAARAGVVVTKDQLAAAKEYEANLSRLSAAASGLGREVGNAVIPALARLSSNLLEGRTAGLGWFDALIKAISGSEDAAKTVDKLTQKLEFLKGKQKEFEGLGQTAAADALNAKIVEIDKALSYYTQKAAEESNKVVIQEAKAADRRVELERQVAQKKTDIAKLLTYVQTGEGKKTEAAAKEETNRRIADQQRLIDAVRTAWKSVRDDADNARAAAVKQRNDANDIAKTTKQSADDIRKQQAADAKDADEKEKKAKEDDKELQIESTRINVTRARGDQPNSDAFSKFQDLRVAQDDANFASAIARNAVFSKTPEQFNKLADNAQTKLQEALKLANEVKDATRVEDLGKELAALSSARAGAKDKEANNLDEQATTQADTLNSLQSQLDQIKQDARAIEVKVELDQAKQALIDLQATIAGIPDKTVTVTVNTVNTGSGTTGSGNTGGAEGSFARGGRVRGPGSATSDSILARLSDGEFVVRAAAVAHYGPGLLQALNQMRLPRFAEGGLAGLRLPRLPRLPAAGAAAPITSSNATFNFPSLGSFKAFLEPDMMSQLKNAFSREALKKGGRR